MKKIITSLAILLISILSVQTLNAETISGNVLYQNDPSRPINDVKVVLTNVEDGTFQSFLTGADGYYEFTDVPNGNFVLNGIKQQSGGGVTYLDAALVFLNVLGYYQLTPLQTLGADVNGNGSVTMTDYNLILSNILNSTSFPVGPWTFESLSFSISGLKDGVPHGIGGTCSGDVGGTFVPTVNNTPALPVAQDGTINISKDEYFTTRIVTQTDISFTGAGIIINYPSELLNIESVEFKGVNCQTNIGNGQIRLIWGNPNTEPINFTAGETFITIHGISTEAFVKGMTATFSLDGNTSLMNSDNQELTKLQFASPVLKYDNPSLKISNFPNPFTTSTKISLYTPEEGNTTLEVYNTAGQLVKTNSLGKMNAGYHEFVLDGTQLDKGYYICKARVQTSNGELSSMVKILKAE